MNRIMPAISARGARVSGLKNTRTELPLVSRSIRRMICAVTVVPMLAPSTMLTAWRRFRIPAPIRPTVSTMVAVELWIMAVTRVPVSSPRNAFCVSFPRNFFSASPEPCFSPSPMISMP